MNTTKQKNYNLVILSNRLPIEKIVDKNQNISWQRSPGGLISALEPIIKTSKGIWIGWNGSATENEQKIQLPQIDMLSVNLNHNEIQNYYEGFANATLWPLYHDVISTPEFKKTWWKSYLEVNKKFALAAAKSASLNGTVWIHDYQLQIVPQLLRSLRQDVNIGFFNHIPFPPSNIFAQIPWRKEILQGLLGADLIGFQSLNDAENFTLSAQNFLNLKSQNNTITTPKTQNTPEHTCKIKHFPISIDTQQFLELTKNPKVISRSTQIRKELGNPKTVILGIERLDYTKGIVHRLQAYEELLEEKKISVKDTTLIQVANPSRERVESYITLRSEVEVTIGRINGKFDTLSHNAIRYLHNTYPIEEMVALYLAADIFLVTSLRDGMNLIAKEYVACRSEKNGVLILSEFAGAAQELSQALIVNPYDIEQLKTAIIEALNMPYAERRKRMRKMFEQISIHDVRLWSNNFLKELEKTPQNKLQPTSLP